MDIVAFTKNGSGKTYGDNKAEQSPRSVRCTRQHEAHGACLLPAGVIAVTSFFLDTFRRNIF